MGLVALSTLPPAAPLSALRDALEDEVDDLPADWVFLLRGVKVGRKQEAKLTLAHLHEAAADDAAANATAAAAGAGACEPAGDVVRVVIRDTAAAAAAGAGAATPLVASTPAAAVPRAPTPPPMDLFGDSLFGPGPIAPAGGSAVRAGAGAGSLASAAAAAAASRTAASAGSAARGPSRPAPGAGGAPSRAAPRAGVQGRRCSSLLVAQG